MNEFYGKQITNKDVADNCLSQYAIHPSSQMIKEYLQTFDLWIWGSYVMPNSARGWTDDQTDIEHDLRLSLDDRSIFRLEEGMWECLNNDFWDVEEKDEAKILPAIATSNDKFATREYELNSSQVWTVDDTRLKFIEDMLRGMDAVVFNNQAYVKSWLDKVCACADIDVDTFIEREDEMISESA